MQDVVPQTSEKQNGANKASTLSANVGYAKISQNVVMQTSEKQNRCKQGHYFVS